MSLLPVSPQHKSCDEQHDVSLPPLPDRRCVAEMYSQVPLQWRHNGHDGVSNHQPYLFDRLFRRRSKKTSKLCVTGLCEGNSPVTGEFPAQRAGDAENVSIWWRHQVCKNADRCLNSQSQKDCAHSYWYNQSSALYVFSTISCISLASEKVGCFILFIHSPKCVFHRPTSLPTPLIQQSVRVFFVVVVISRTPVPNTCSSLCDWLSIWVNQYNCLIVLHTERHTLIIGNRYKTAMLRIPGPLLEESLDDRWTPESIATTRLWTHRNRNVDYGSIVDKF